MSTTANAVDVTGRILAMERAALDRWGKGDPSGYLEINDAEVSYFDPFQDERLDGLPALEKLYESIRGKVKIERDEIIDPRIQPLGDAAILTFRFVSHGSEGSMRWNCTEVYRRFQDDDWRIVHSHWSFTKAAQVQA
jgi:ketosteroid isomerase-like protein